jgi:drug/metabolite transporter (DMT)-like permease
MKKALLQLHIAIFLWGFTGVLGKLIEVNEITLVYYRLIITFFSLIFLDLVKPSFQILATEQKIKLCITGSLQAIHWVCFFASIKYANVAVALICLSSTSFFTLLFEKYRYKKPIDFVELMLSIVSMAGIALIFYADFELKKGIIFGILSAMFVSLVAVNNKKFLDQVNTETITVWNIGGGLLTISILLPLYLYFANQRFELPNGTDIQWLLVLSWLCTIVTWKLSLASLKKVSAFTQNLSMNMEPIYGILLATFFLQEYKTYTIWFYLGISLIILTIIFQTIHIKKKDKNESTI